MVPSRQPPASCSSMEREKSFSSRVCPRDRAAVYGISFWQSMTHRMGCRSDAQGAG